MRIEEIRLQNWKSIKAATYPIDRLNLLAAPNGRGKSGVLAALRFAVNGTCAAGARADDVIQLTRGGMGGAVGVQLDNDYQWIRGLTRNPATGAISASLTIAGSDARTQAQRAAEILDRVGDLAETFDLSIFTGLSPDKQREKVLELCGKARRDNAIDLMSRVRVGWYKEAIGPDVVDLAVEADGLPKAFERLAPRLSDAQRAAAKVVFEGLRAVVRPNQDLTESLTLVGARAKDIANASKTSRDGLQRAIAELSERRAALGVDAGKARDVLVAERDALRAEQSDVAGSIGAIDAHAAELKRATDAVDGLRFAANAARESLRTAVETPPSPVADADDYDRRAAEIRAQLDSLGDVDVPVREAERAHDAARDGLERARRAVASATGQLNDAQIRQRSTTRELGALDASPWARALELYDDLFRTYPGEVAVALADNRATVLAEGALLDFLRAQGGVDRRDALVAELATADQQVEQAQADQDAAVAARDAAQARVTEATAKLDAARATANEQRSAASRQRAEADGLASQASKIRTSVENHDATVKRLTQARNAADNDLAAAERKVLELQRVTHPATLADLTARRDDLATRIRHADAAIEARVRYDGLNAEYAKMVADMEDQQQRHEVAKQFVAAIKAVRETLLADLVRPLIDRMQRFLTAAGLPHEARCVLAETKGEDIKAVFRLGWIVRGDAAQFITLDAMSGGEQALFSAALAYAIVSVSDVPLKLLLIEAAELDADNMRRLLAGLEVVAGDVSNVIVATHREIQAPGWNVIDPSRVGEMAVAA